MFTVARNIFELIYLLCYQKQKKSEIEIEREKIISIETEKIQRKHFRITIEISLVE